MRVEYRSDLIALLSIDAPRAGTRPYSDDRRRSFSSAPRSHHRGGASQTADRARDRFGDRLVAEVSGLVSQNGNPPPLRIARRAERHARLKARRQGRTKSRLR